jgi:hypothetical protein
MFVRGRGLIKSIQRGTTTIAAAATSGTSTITSVDTANAVIRLLGYTYSATAITDGRVLCPRLELTNGTTVTAYRNTADASNSLIVSWEVIEYYPGVLKSVQRGTINVNGTATITAVDTAKSSCDHLGGTYLANTANDPGYYGYVTLTNGTTVTATNGSGAGPGYGTMGFQVVEWY